MKGQRQDQVPDWPALYAQLAEQSRDPRLKAFYQAGVVAMDTPIEAVPLLALDVETTGLDAQQHAIISLGLVPLDLQRIRCGEARYWVVKPTSELSGESVPFHRITHSDIRHAPRLTHILDELLAAMQGHVMVVHYRNIERGFIDQAVRQQLGEGLHFPVIDTMQLEARLHRTRQPGWLAKLLGRQPTSIRLADSRLRYNLPLYQAHHALTDALATAELLQAQVATHYALDTPVGALWS
ncbi:MAG: 3'-5' exonuclease [Gammaproteobacteria bacterium]|nr:3'-5' exonuclease [Gammaproteobacteria bacterium]MBU1490054.1 3'-5' exonuclease [Gammaproteobacteria bacterium]MBU2066636.1 3'-5' exonuclease [Gammaproteobacteria bacterium]MBU2138805.1 3'-5' exonuclease [Gammaproteobacteria bacterium]MBU2216148.1 3'-5' exonuclease [Gammaproteobacteria bacterium]